MDQTIKAQWVTALRSGDYKQGRQSLKQGDAYCCLGVLCDLHSKAHPGHLHSWRFHEPDYMEVYKDCYSYDGMTMALPGEVKDWAGLSSDDPDIDVDYSKPQHEIKSLGQLNDAGYTFAQLAQLIEEQL